jgi:hypothetical protein
MPSAGRSQGVPTGDTAWKGHLRVRPPDAAGHGPGAGPGRADPPNSFRYVWLRFVAAEATKLKMDVYSAVDAAEGLLMAGDSIANMQCTRAAAVWFATGVAARALAAPPLVGGGIAFTTAVNGRALWSPAPETSPRTWAGRS